MSCGRAARPGVLWPQLVLALGCWVCAPCGASAAQGRSETQLLAQVEAIDRALVRAEANLAAGENDVRALASAVAAAESARAAAADAYGQATAQLRRRLGALTRMGPQAQLVALKSVQSLSMLMDDERLLAAIAKHDRDLWAAHEATRVQLETTIALAQERAQALEAAQQQRRVARDDLAQSRQRKNRALQGMRRRREDRAVGAELQLAQVRLAQVVQRAAAAAAGGSAAAPRPPARSAGLPWPASGPVRVGFGQHTEAAFGTATFHNGWDIAAAAGSPVVAVAAGKVAYASWLHGYGQVAIVEHPGGYHTVHGHLSQLHVTSGQRVRPGDLLGAVGDTGSLRGTVLYFEIRHRGLPQDPRLFLRRRR